jgi:hypothetical protein
MLLQVVAVSPASSALLVAGMGTDAQVGGKARLQHGPVLQMLCTHMCLVSVLYLNRSSGPMVCLATGLRTWYLVLAAATLMIAVTGRSD